MRAPISVVIPTLNSELGLAALLSDLGAGLDAGLIRELVVTDGGSQDKTQTLAEAAGAEWVVGPPSRGGQLARGCVLAQGDWLLVLHSDTRLPPTWAADVQAHLSRQAPAAFRLSFDADGFWPGLVAGWANLRTRLLSLPYGDQGLLVPRAAYDAAGGYTDQPLMEDVALVRRLPKVQLLPSHVTTGAERYVTSGWLRRGSANLVTLALYFLGKSPERLAERYRRR